MPNVNGGLKANQNVLCILIYVNGIFTCDISNVKNATFSPTTGPRYKSTRKSIKVINPFTNAICVASSVITAPD